MVSHLLQWYITNWEWRDRTAKSNTDNSIKKDPNDAEESQGSANELREVMNDEVQTNPMWKELLNEGKGDDESNIKFHNIHLINLKLILYFTTHCLL